MRHGINHIIIKGTENNYNNQSIVELDKKDFLHMNVEFCLKEEEGRIILKFLFLSKDENLQLVNHEACSMAVDVVPHVDNPTFEEDGTPDQETVVQEIKS